MAMARRSVGVASRQTASAEAKLALLEDLQRCADPAAAAQSAAEWLLAHAGAERTVFVAPDHARGALAGIAGAGVPARQLKKFVVSLDDSTHPLVNALTNGSVVSFHNPHDARSSVFGDAPFTSVKVGGTGRGARVRVAAHQPGGGHAGGERQMGSECTGALP